MAGLKLKSGADFCNFEAFRMRLHNAGEDPTSDFGVGQIYFNTSDTSVGSARHVRLYDGTKFRSLAYLDEIAKNEAFLALKDRVDLLSGEVDTDAIISNMKEVSAFLEGFAEDASLMDYLNTELGKKLDISGGEMTGKLVMYNRISMGNQVIEMGKGLFGAYNDGEKLYWLTPSNETWNEILTSAGGTIISNSYGGGLILKRNASNTGVALWFANNSGSLGGLVCNENKELLYDNGATAHTLLHSGNYSNYALPLSGGTINGSLTLNEGALYFISGGKQYAYNVNTGNGEPIYLKNDAWQTLLHSGNVGEYNAGSANILASSYNENINYESYTTHLKLIKSTSGDYVANGFPAQYVSGLSVMSGYTGWQMVTYGDPASDMRPYFRAVGGEGDWQAWKQLAFTDSNVASAQALIHSNGTVGATVGEAGNLCINKRISSADDSLNLFEYSAGFLYLGYSLRNEHTTRVYGNKIEFLTGDTQRMLINSSGNVTIGASDLAGTDAKLYVDGDIHLGIAKLCSIGAPYSASDPILYNRIAIGSSYDGIKYYSGSWTGDDDKISHEFIVGVENKSALAITNGGNVLIGTTDDNGAELQVAGSSTILGALSASTSFDLNRDGDNGNIFNSERAAFEIETLAKTVRFRTFNPNVNNVLTFYGSQGNVGIGKIAYTHKLEVEGNVHISGSLIVDGEVSAGGAGTEGGNAGGGGAFHSESIGVGATQTTIAHGLGTDDIVVSIYEKDGVSGRWSIILTDVEIVDANNIIVSFGSATSVEHKVVIMGAVA